MAPDLDDLTFSREFVASLRWQTATTVPQFPHAYSLKRWLPPDRRAEFDRFADLIARHGEPGLHVSTGDRVWVYLVLGEFRYWISNELFGDGAGLIVNRALRELDGREGAVLAI